MTLYIGPDDPEVLLSVLTDSMKDRVVAERLKASLRESRRKRFNSKCPIPDLDMRAAAKELR